MMDKLVANNGWELRGNGALYSSDQAISPLLGKKSVDALRVMFQHERDEQLARWRWPEHPDYVVYGSAHSATVFHEPTGSWSEWGRRDLTLSEVGRDSLAQAAEAYFEAHPEPTPLPREPHTAWVDKYGTDIWWVDGFGVLRCCASPSSDPAKYAPFTQLVKAVSDD